MDKMYCWECGKKISKDTSICLNCGAKQRNRIVIEKSIEKSIEKDGSNKSNKKVQIVLIIIGILLIIIIMLFLLFLKNDKIEQSTIFYIVLEEPPSFDEISKINDILVKRFNLIDMIDIKISVLEDQKIAIRMKKRNPEYIEKLKKTILKQGKFEAVLDGEVLFVGEDIRTIYKDPAKGYGIQQVDRSGASQWVLPFMLSPEASRRFAEMTFHKCTAVGYDSKKVEYDCEKTYFFIDRPVDAIFVVDTETYSDERQVPISPEMAGSDLISFDEIISQVNTNYYVVGSELTEEEKEKILIDSEKYSKVIVSSSVSESVREELDLMGYRVIVVNKPETQPWIWEATGLKSIISLTEGVTNMSAPTTSSPKFETFSSLTITGSASSRDEAKQRLDDLLVILESGSLPINITKIIVDIKNSS